MMRLSELMNVDLATLSDDEYDLWVETMNMYWARRRKSAAAGPGSAAAAKAQAQAQEGPTSPGPVARGKKRGQDGEVKSVKPVDWDMAAKEFSTLVDEFETSCKP